MKKLVSTAVTSALLASSFLGSSLPAFAANGDEFTCSPNFYQVSSTGSGAFYKYDPSTSIYERVGVASASGINAIGYNTVDNYIYGIANGNLMRINKNGAMTDLGATTGLSGTSGGDFIPGTQTMYVAGSNATGWTKLDITTKTATAYSISGSWGAADLTVVGTKAYGLKDSTLYTVDLGASSGVGTTKTVTGTTTGSYGAAYSDASGNLYFFNNNNSKLYKIAADQLGNASPAAVLLTTASPALGAPNDGASCSLAASPFDPPAPTNDSYASNLGSTIIVDASTTNTLITNDQAASAFKIKDITYAGQTITSNGQVITGPEGVLTITDVVNGYFTFAPSPTFTGTTTFTYTLIETSGSLRASTAPATVTINYLAATTSTLPNGTKDAPYTANLSAAGGTTGNYTWTLTNGTLPAGLTLASDGTISGTPTEAVENLSLTFQVTDSGITHEVTISLTVNDTTPPPVDPPTNLPPTVSNEYQTTSGITPINFTPTITDEDLNIPSACIVTADGCVTELITPEGVWNSNGDGTFNFTPTLGVISDSTISYRVYDQAGQYTDGQLRAAVTLPPAPTVQDVTKETPHNTSTSATPTVEGLGIDLSAGYLFLNDSECMNNDNCNAGTELVVPGEGTWTYNTTTGEVTFAPIDGYAGNPTEVRYVVTDAYGQVSNSGLYITVGLPDAPLLSNPTINTSYNTPVTTTVTTGNGSVLNGSTACIVDPADDSCKKIVVIPNEGTWTVDATTGDVTFSPAEGFYGTTTPVTYQITDGYQQLGTIPLTATVGEPAAPIENTTVSGIVWLDLNHDGSKDDNEPLLPGVPVTMQQALTPASVRQASLLATVTDANGAYSFVTLPGDYIITAELTSANLDPSWDTDGLADWVASVTAASGTPATADFAAAGSGTIQGTVTFDSGEIIPNAYVTCTWAGLDGILGNTDDVNIYGTTNANGTFGLAGIPGGDYTCLGTDPATNKTSSASQANVDPTGVENTVVTLPIVADSNSGNNNSGNSGNSNTAAATKTETLAYTGSTPWLMVWMSIISFSAIFGGAAMQKLGQSRRGRHAK